MHYLFLTAFIWAFSFGLVKTHLMRLDPNFVAMARLGIALILFAPFFKMRELNPRQTLRLIAVGAIQYGLTYLFYQRAITRLAAFETALFIIFAPFWVTFWSDLYCKRFQPLNWSLAALAVLGAGIIQYQTKNFNDFWFGFGLIQLANICFAFGQVDYKYWRIAHPAFKDHQIYAALYLGAFILTAAATTYSGSWGAWAHLQTKSALTLLYLGVFASGLSFYWWNKGAISTNPGTLAAMGVVKIPLGVACSLVFFGESTHILRLVCGGSVIIIAVGLSEVWQAIRSQPVNQN